MKAILCSILVCLGYQLFMSVESNCLAQEPVQDSLTVVSSALIRQRNNAVLFELGGAGGLYSIGYERVFVTSRNRYWQGVSSIDFGNFGKFWIFDVHMTSSVNASVIYGKKHRAEVEIGWVWIMDFDVPFNLSEQRHNKLYGTHYRVTFRTLNTIGAGYRYSISEKWEVKSKPMWVFKYDFDYEKMTWSSFWMDFSILYKF